MKISFLREYIDLCSDLNFGASAQRQHMSISTLSKHIQALEKDLGTQLINRTSPATLTQAGNSFLRYAYQIYDLYQEAKTDCSTKQDDARPRLKIDAGVNPSTTGDRFSEFIRAYRQAAKDSDIIMVPHASNSIIQSLKSCEVDLGMIATISECTLSTLGQEGIAYILFDREEVLVWVSKESALEKKEMLTLDDLAVYNICLPYRFRHDTWREAYREVFAQAGHHVRFVLSNSPTVNSIALELQDKNELLILPASIFDNLTIFKQREDRVVKHLNPPVYATTYVCFRKDDNNPALLAFIQAFKDHFSFTP